MNMTYSYKNKRTTYSTYMTGSGVWVNGDLNVTGNVNGYLNGEAKSIKPNDFPISGSPNVVNSGNGTQDAILTFETGSRNYKWRLRARGNGTGAEFYLEYYQGNGNWGVAQRWPSSSGYHDAEGGDNQAQVTVDVDTDTPVVIDDKIVETVEEEVKKEEKEEKANI